MIKRLGVILFFALAAVSCDKNEIAAPQPITDLTGTGNFTFKSYAPLADKPIRVFYHIPTNLLENSPVLLVFHGNGRDAAPSRDALIAKANKLGFVVLVPEFSRDLFPGSDTYHLGNIFEDGDHPSPQTLHPKEEWTFSMIDPLFEYFKKLTGLTAPTYDVLGHSAGGQVAHRFVYFWNEAHYNRIVASASGWYTMPHKDVSFPYGLAESPAEELPYANIFRVPLTVLIGTADNDPNAASLRHTSQADAQGSNRLARAQYFFQQSAALAQSNNAVFAWQYRTMNNVGHDFEASAAYAADLLY
jgi:pimeloyl-ACP methyl ester carboxylesterase